ncbi:MAG TPA: class I SAM-dependent methyltransferase [Anaerolineales bacterium]|nr:class I SAM-dependent methyltransferase [Anaerolineales bacterium]
MNHNDHVDLLRPADLLQGGIYADFGAGGGAFTLALRELIGPDAVIYAVDNDRASLRELESNYRARFNTTENLILLKDDFTLDLDIPPLDGVVMANSLHFFKDKDAILRHVRGFLKPNGVLLIVEYNVDVGNMWVPYPVSFNVCRVLVKRAGFTEPRLLAKTPSSFMSEFYSVAANRIEK